MMRQVEGRVEGDVSREGPYTPAMTADRSAEELAALARELVRIPSPNPPGAEDRIARFAAQWLREAGLEAELIPLEPGRRSVVARLAGRDPGSIVLCGHLDTVPTELDAWSVPPFEGRIQAGRLWGLGAADMKGPVAVLMQVLAELARRSEPPRHNLVLALTADEEFGYRGAASIADSGRIDDAILLLIAEPTDGNLYVGQKGELWIEAEFTGLEAHGSTPEAGVSALLPAARFTAALATEIASLAETPGAGRTSLNVGRFDAGRQVNIVPERARIQLDLRTARAEDRDDLIARIDAIGRREAAVEGAVFAQRTISDHPPILGNPKDPNALRLSEAVATVTGAPPAIGLCPFSTDAVAIVPRHDVPVIICGPGRIADAHRPDESIALEALRAHHEILLQFLS